MRSGSHNKMARFIFELRCDYEHCINGLKKGNREANLKAILMNS
jgi:hypothetical protein